MPAAQSRVSLVVSHAELVGSYAEPLAAALREELRLSVGAPLVANFIDNAKPVDLETAQRALKAAQEAFVHLEAGVALQHLEVAESSLRRVTAQAEARRLLATVLRLRGQAQLFLERAGPAAESFVSAFFLTPEFSPAAEEWPPEARLAYADAVAAAKRGGAGSLSITVGPRTAELFIDGARVGCGSISVENLLPGPHYLLVTAVGFESSGAVIEISGAGKLNTFAAFLQPLSGDHRQADAAGVLLAALAGPREQTVAAQVVELVGAAALVVLDQPASADAKGAPVARVFDVQGKRLGAPITMSSPAEAALAIRLRLLGESNAAVVATSWYLQWPTWAVAGAVVVAGSVVLGYELLKPDNQRVTFTLGRE